jgi:hypothetical protein
VTGRLKEKRTAVRGVSLLPATPIWELGVGDRIGISAANLSDRRPTLQRARRDRSNDSAGHTRLHNRSHEAPTSLCQANLYRLKEWSQYSFRRVLLRLSERRNALRVSLIAIVHSITGSAPPSALMIPRVVSQRGSPYRPQIAQIHLGDYGSLLLFNRDAI